MKGPTEKHFEGIYANPRLVHSVGQILGCLVHVQVKSGDVYEGVFKTFSNKADFVLEMVQKVDLKASASANTVISSPNPEDNTDKVVFSFNDVVMLSSFNVDPEYATRESFTDTAISKFNGQVLERELEPWDGEPSADGLLDLGTGEEEANGWDPQDMFKTNEEKYGVKSSFDKNLAGYTIPLNKQNTEEYRQKEEKADKVATEIESSLHHKNRAALENGDEEDRFSAVVRPDNLNNFKYVNHRQRRSTQNMRNMRNSNSNGTAPHMNNSRSSHQQHSHTQVFQRISSPATTANNNQGHYRQSVSSVVSPRQTPSTSPKQAPVTVQQPQATVSCPPGQFQSVAQAVTSPVPQTVRTSPPQSSVPHEDGHKMNGEADKTELKFAPKPPRSLNLHSSANKEMRESMLNTQMSNKNIERRKDSEKKTTGQKTRDEKTEDLKRFHAKFKLSEDPKDNHERGDSTKSEAPSSVGAGTPPKHPGNKDRQKEEERRTPDSRKSPDTPKNYTLNPNAKEFVFNPNAKSFTPRGVAMAPVQQQQPPRLHTQSPIMAMQPHMMPQTVFAPHYVVSATPVSMAQMAPPFNPAASVAQAPRFRKAAMPMSLRHDLSQPVHVQAATGQPILAQPTLSAAPQFTIQYTPPGMLHPPGPPQQLAYTQMYSLMPRVLTPQPVSMVPTSAAYGENPQIPTHVYMSHPAGPGIQHAMTSGGNGNQHSTPSTPQSQTPNIHPAPSPVHQQPQPAPTPTGHHSNAPTPQPVMYTTHGHMAAQHPMHAQSTNQGHPFAAAPYAGAPQPIVLLQQQPHHPGTFASSLQNHLHAQNPGGNHVGTPTHVLPHAPLAMIPTSAGMVHTQTAGHYVPHSQV